MGEKIDIKALQEERSCGYLPPIPVDIDSICEDCGWGENMQYVDEWGMIHSYFCHKHTTPVNRFATCPDYKEPED